MSGGAGFPLKTVAIVGLGLIGGSLAKAIKKNTPCRVLGLDKSETVLEQALACGAIDKACAPKELAQADLVFLCLYPQQAMDFVTEHLTCFRKGGLVTDVAGIKGMICQMLPPLAQRGGFTFIASHPMAGREKNGFSASDADLFCGASYLLVPCGAPQAAVQTLSAFALRLGFAGVRLTTAEEHDRMIAFTSQLPHALACAYVLSPQCPNHKGFSAGSYRDVSRVARINETLWSELFLDNRDALIAELDCLMGNLQDIRNAIQAGDREELTRLLRRGRQIKEDLGE